MAICPVCHANGELCEECKQCHKHCVEENDLRKSGNDPILGDLVGGQYVPLALIGEGGMGRIYRAKAKYTGKVLALKILKSEYMEDETLKDRFFREAEVVSALDHPNIVKLYSCAPDETHNTIFMAMELLKGRSLFDVLRKDSTLPPLEVMLRFFCEISSALGEAHKHGIFHRDLKPENVFIIKDDDGEEHAKVLDFGFARLQGASKKLTMAGVAFGTPHYMSPEQAMGLENITAACDVYALGIMLFQAISGHVPFDSANHSPMEVMYDQVHKNTPKCEPRAEYEVSESLIKCIYKCMKKKPEERYENGNALAAELKNICDNLSSEASFSKAKTVILDPVARDAGRANIPSQGVPVLIWVLAGVLGTLIIVAVVLFAFVF